jgi:hypothetical protein
MGAKTQNAGPQLLIFILESWVTYVVKDNGSEWLKWLTKQEGVTFPPNHTQRQQV